MCWGDEQPYLAARFALKKLPEYTEQDDKLFGNFNNVTRSEIESSKRVADSDECLAVP